MAQLMDNHLNLDSHLSFLTVRESRNTPSTIQVHNLCQKGMDQLGHPLKSSAVETLNPSPPVANQTLICSSPAGPSAGHHLLATYSPSCAGLTESRPAGWFDGFFGRIRSVFRSWDDLSNKGDEWEIPFETLSDLEHLASGTQGVVYKARIRNEIVAVKKVDDKKEAEIPVLRQLNHPNIIRFKGACNQAPNYCLVMEYCPNGTLYDFLRSENKLSPQLTFEWAVQIASGMHYLHQNNIMHRDLKSPNILLDANNVVKITDFGTCRTFNNQSVLMTVIGTYAWMAPEVICKEKCWKKVDVWSYGVVLWELLTRETPYRDQSYGAIIYGVGSNRLQLHLPSTIPPGFLRLLEMCRRQVPRKRPSFYTILLLLSKASTELIDQDPEHYANLQLEWKMEIRPPCSGRDKCQSTVSNDTFYQVDCQQSIDVFDGNHKYNNNDPDGEHPLFKRLAQIRHVDEIHVLLEEKVAELMQSEIYAEVAYLTAILKEIQGKPKSKPIRIKQRKRSCKRNVVKRNFSVKSIKGRCEPPTLGRRDSSRVVNDSCQFDQKDLPDQPNSSAVASGVVQSSWETCSDDDEEEINFPTAKNQEVFLRKSVGRNPIRTRRPFKDRPTSVYSGNSTEENRLSLISVTDDDGVAGNMSDV
uniref:Mitogen-activated protein kinase kinase kinase n=1 Tax=Daphnia magna TaxID=35525 RepID=A0A0P6D808_9CRUS